jgi:hypothetical protein
MHGHMNVKNHFLMFKVLAEKVSTGPKSVERRAGRITCILKAHIILR